MRTLLTARWLCTPLEQMAFPYLLIEDGLIVDLDSCQQRALPQVAHHLDFGGAILAPGLIDLHLHGGAGHDVMEATPDALAAIGRQLAVHGITAYCPTTVTAPLAVTLRALDGLSRLAPSSLPPDCARPVGIHLEGPFLSPARRGAHPPDLLVSPDLAWFEHCWEAAQGEIRILTMAPELAGAEAVIRRADACGICVALGHSDAQAETVREALAWGARHVTHTFNGMRPLHQRDLGMLGAALTEDRLSADVIADGVHVAPALVRLFLQAKPRHQAVLISDAISATGKPDGRYRLGPIEVEVQGACCRANGSLAGSVLLLDQALRNVMQFAGWDLAATLPLVTRNPALVLRQTFRRGTLSRRPGSDAAQRRRVPRL